MTSTLRVLEVWSHSITAGSVSDLDNLKLNFLKNDGFRVDFLSSLMLLLLKIK